jgi:hypothetical protein
VIHHYKLIIPQHYKLATMSEKGNEDIKSAGKGDVIVIEIIQKKRKDRENAEKEDCKLISNYQKQVDIGNGSHDVIACTVVAATIADVHAIVAAHPVGVLPAAFLNLPANVAANTAALAPLAGVPAAQAANAAALAALAGVPAALAALAGVPAALAALTDAVALANNRGCNDLDHPLIPRAAPVVNAQVPAGFPPTLRALMALPGAVVDSFLQYWNLPVNGTLVSRKKRLGTFLGIPARLI